MQLLHLIGTALSAAAIVAASPLNGGSQAIRVGREQAMMKRTSAIAPKVFIISMFDPENEVWYGIPEFDILAHNITIAGLSPLYESIHCTYDYEICTVITGESEINAASTITALTLSSEFDLTKTYFMVAGIAGISPKVGTLGSVTFARYAIQVALQYEFDMRDLSSNWTTGYVPLGSTLPSEYPSSIYGTEVFEVNDALKKLAVGFAKTATLNDSAEAVVYRAHYSKNSSLYAAATVAPNVLECDAATSDVYYSGTLLSESFDNFTTMMTNGTGVYCTTAQEDNATLEALLRAAIWKLVDFSRIIIMRTASDFDRPYPGEDATTNLFWADQGGFEPAIQNIYLAGVKVVEGIIDNWNSTFEKGVNATNYIGDIFGSLGGEPDFGPGSEFDNTGVVVKRGLLGRKGRKVQAVRRRGGGVRL
ncbi:MAG: hypothetical protein M1834_006510 [Cirrosporium novae-zelandiae]|nr:MAG: hypothetical protein M1834_006510 [Cirrosporium novae-zelandiae]